MGLLQLPPPLLLLRRLHGKQAPHLPALLLCVHRGSSGHPVQRQQPCAGHDAHVQVLPGAAQVRGMHVWDVHVRLCVFMCACVRVRAIAEVELHNEALY